MVGMVEGGQCGGGQGERREEKGEREGDGEIYSQTVRSGNKDRKASWLESFVTRSLLAKKSPSSFFSFSISVDFSDFAQTFSNSIKKNYRDKQMQQRNYGEIK